MISHIIVYKRLVSLLESRGYKINPSVQPWQSPLKANHPDSSELEIYFYGENFTFDWDSTPFDLRKMSRSERLNIWQTEKTMMSEEAGHICAAKAVLLAITRLGTKKNRTRIGLAFPDNHNFMKYLEPVVIPLSKVGIEFFFITSTLEVAAIGKDWKQLPSADDNNLLKP